MDKAEKAGGNVVDLPPNLLEGYGLQLLLKRVAEYSKKQFHIAADGDMKVIFCEIILMTQTTWGIGHYTQISNLCNPSFVNEIGYDCNTFRDNGWCPLNSMPAEFYIAQGVPTYNGIETGLNCPECGCNVNPPSLYDVHWEPG